MTCKIIVELKDLIVNQKNNSTGSDEYWFHITVNGNMTRIPTSNNIEIPNEIILPAGIGINRTLFSQGMFNEMIDINISIKTNEGTDEGGDQSNNQSYGGFSFSNLSCKNMVTNNRDILPFLLNTFYRVIDTEEDLDITFNFLIRVV
ncbi:hypothetical protein QNH20_09990 [Neobacillus sp. WH10]|uniref:hypothetical protein n=1 Tax=Neobacillus sp. WH10 TaxID=3047873 RepID=UPI0024C0F26A|nr:hypothetical protein [Neobacillus sp. WH10]WHY79439.1 hypothetical protein QNH20_09990 [Neobacillus sp. WH10]